MYIRVYVCIRLYTYVSGSVFGSAARTPARSPPGFGGLRFGVWGLGWHHRFRV